MTSPKRRLRGRSRRILFLAILSLVAAAVFMLWREPVASVLWLAAEPVVRFGNSVTAGELERFKAELASSTILALDRQLLYEENQHLKLRLGRTPENTRSILAAVLLRPPGTPYDTLMLDVGRQDGVAVGDLVFAGGSVVVGTISEVYAGASRATLFSAPGKTHNALIFAEGGSIPVSLEGQGAGSFIGRIPQGMPVAAGQAVIFPNINPVLVASVSYIESREGESFQTVYMALPVNPFTLRFVEVRKPQT